MVILLGRDLGIDGFKQVGRCPFVTLGADFEADQLAFRVDDRRAKIMNDFILPRSVDQPERARRSAPIPRAKRRRTSRAAGGPSNPGMFAQDFRRVMVGIERDRDQPDFLARSGKTSIDWARSANLRSMSGQKSGRGQRV